MKPCSAVVSVLFFAAFLAFGCVAPPAPPAEAPAQATTEATTEAPTEVTTEAPTEATTEAPIDQEAQLALKHDACLSHIAFYPELAFSDYTGAVLWTFSLNFLESGEPDQWLGCLRFYYRAEQAHTFIGTLDSAFLIPCYAYGGSVRTATINEAIRDTDGGNRGSALNRVGVFDGGHLECPINIGKAAGAMLRRAELTSELDALSTIGDQANARQGLGALATEWPVTQTHFAVAAGIRSVAGTGGANPLITYVSQPPDSANALAFAVPTIGTKAGAGSPEPLTFYANVNGQGYQPDLQGFPSPSECWFTTFPTNPPDDPPGAYAWFNFGVTHRHNADVLGFTSEPVARPNEKYCGQSMIMPQLVRATYEYVTGDAVIYVGFDPATSQVFQGELYEVWFDPDLGPKPGG